MAVELEGDNQVPLTPEQRERAQRYFGYVARWRAGPDAGSSRFSPLLRQPGILDDAAMEVARWPSAHAVEDEATIVNAILADALRRYRSGSRRERRHAKLLWGAVQFAVPSTDRQNSAPDADPEELREPWSPVPSPRVAVEEPDQPILTSPVDLSVAAGRRWRNRVLGAEDTAILAAATDAVSLCDLLTPVALLAAGVEAGRIALATPWVANSPQRRATLRSKLGSVERELVRVWRRVRQPLRERVGDLVLRVVTCHWSRRSLRDVPLSLVLERIDSDIVGERDGGRSWYLLLGPPGEWLGAAYNMRPLAAPAELLLADAHVRPDRLWYPVRGGRRKEDLGSIAAAYAVAAMDEARMLQEVQSDPGWRRVVQARQMCLAALRDVARDDGDVVLRRAVCEAHEALAALPAQRDRGPVAVADIAVRAVADARSLGTGRARDKSVQSVRRNLITRLQKAALHAVKRSPGRQTSVASRAGAFLPAGLKRILNLLIERGGTDLADLRVAGYVPRNACRRSAPRSSEYSRTAASRAS
jgi:hypothetical protein